MTHILFTLFGFMLGSILFSQLLPKLILKKDICEIGEDGNPGAANVFMKCGVPMGIVCVLLDIFKGALPVLIACYNVDTKSLLFALVIIAPVMGHALGIFNKGRGGKCIATSFGVLIGLFPITLIGLLLALFYILFSTVLKISPNAKRSIITFLLFGIGALIILLIRGLYSVALGCALISVIAITKHLPRFSNKKNNAEEIEEKEKCTVTK